MSLGVSIGGFVPSMSAVNVWMPHKRATAMSWVIGGSSFGGFFMPLMVLSMEALGWRLTLVILGFLFVFFWAFIGICNKKKTRHRVFRKN